MKTPLEKYRQQTYGKNVQKLKSKPGREPVPTKSMLRAYVTGTYSAAANQTHTLGNA